MAILEAGQVVTAALDSDANRPEGDADRPVLEIDAGRVADRVGTWAITAALAAAAVVLYALALVGAPEYLPDTGVSVAYIAVAMFLAEIAALRMAIQNRTVPLALTDIPMVVGFYCLAPTDLMIARLIGSGLALAIIHRRSPRLGALAFVTVMAASAVGIIVFREVARIAPAGIAGWLAASYAGTAVMVLVTVGVATLHASVTRRHWGERELPWRLAVGLGTAFVNCSVALVAVVFIVREPAGLWLLLAPAAVGLLGYRAFIAQRSRQARLEFMWDSWQIIQVPVLDDSVLARLLARVKLMFRAAIVEVILARDGSDGSRRMSIGPDGRTSSVAISPEEVEGRRALLGPGGTGRRLERGELAPAGGGRAMIVAVRGAGGVIGSLLVADTREDLEPFGADDVRVLEALGSRLGLLVENSGLAGLLAASEGDVTKLAAIVQTTNDAIVAIDQAGRINAWNAASSRLFGRPAEDMLGEVADEVLTDGSGPGLRDGLAAALAGQPSGNVQMEWLRPDGTSVPVAITVSPIRGELGEIQGASAIVRDETDRRSAEASAAAAAERLRLVIDGSPIGIGTAGPDQRWIRANPALCALLGEQPGDVDGRPVTELVHPDDAATIGQLEDLLFAGEDAIHSVERRYVSRGGAVVWARVTARPTQDSPGGGKVALYTVQDITERRTAEERTRITEERFRRAALTITAIQDPSRIIGALLEAMRETLRAEYAAFATYAEDDSGILEFEVSGLDPVAMRARMGHLPSGSGVLALASRLGRPVRLRDLQAHPDFGGFPPAHPTMTSFLALPLTQDRPGRATLYVANKVDAPEFSEGDEAIAVALATHAAVCLENARVTAQARDLVAELDRANGELLRANDAKSQFLGTVAHELRAPLHAIVVAAELVNDPPLGPLSPDQVTNLGATIESSGRHMVRLIDDLADLARIEAGRMEIRPTEVVVGDVLAEVASSLAAIARAQRITLELPEGPGPRVVADPVRLRQILTNLVDNALKFTGRGGRVWVEVSTTRSSIQVTVHDTGIGIAKPDLERAFLPFEQVSRTSKPGAGLGLAISRSLAELHDGRLDAASVPGSGSSFTLTLPRQPQAGEPTSPTGSGRLLMPADGAGRTILAVEDDPTALGLAIDVLRMAGYQVLAATGLAEARERLDRSTPALILLDLRLGDESGLDLVAYAKAHPRTAHVPILVVSADTLPEDVRRAREAGCDDVLSKPLSPRRLLSRVHDLTQDRSEAGSPG